MGSRKVALVATVPLYLSFLVFYVFAQAPNPIEQSARAVIDRNCMACHGDAQTSGLDMREKEKILKGGKRGPAVVPGKAEQSLLYQAAAHLGDLKMPPGKERIPDTELKVLHDWITDAALWKVAKFQRVHFTEAQKSFWSFQPILDPPAPKVKATDWVKNPIDNFILAKLEEKGLSPVPPADKRTLIRRVTYDLTGLPPTAAEIDAFLADDSPEAYKKLVDRLLASPQYGEQWGRHWLDVARYADTTSTEGSFIMRYAYRYRDYVIRAFNDDKPFDQYIVEQLAGDLLPPARDLDLGAQRMIATGFLELGEKLLVAGDKEQLRWDVVDEQIDVTGRAFLGLTVACARCHDHKFDPIPTRDYYALAGIFKSTRVLIDDKPGNNVSMWTEMPLLRIPGEQQVFIMAPKDEAPVNAKIHIRGSLTNLGEEVPRGFPEILLGDKPDPPISSQQSGRLELARWIASAQNPLTARVMANRIWQGHFGTGLVASSDNFGSLGTPPTHPELLDWLASQFIDGGWSVKAMHRLILLSNTYQMQSIANEKADQVDPENRLLWRMNRRRLIAEELRDSMLAISGELDTTMGGSLFDWQKKAGYFDPERGLFSATDVKPGTVYDAFNSLRRTVYLPIIRTEVPSQLDLFDFADPNACTVRRSDTTNAPQALFLMNSLFVRERSMHFAEQLMSGISDNPLFKPLVRLGITEPTDEDRLRLAHVVVLGRPPRAQELAHGLAFINEYIKRAQARHIPDKEARLAAWQSYCQTMFMLSEFLYAS